LAQVKSATWMVTKPLVMFVALIEELIEAMFNEIVFGF
jgi:hypothetical protein